MMAMFDWMFDGETHSRLDVMNSKLDALIECQKETNYILQEILKKIEIRLPQRRSACVTPGLVYGLRDPSSVLRIRLP